MNFAREYSKVITVDYFVFGNLHCAGDYNMGEGRRAIFLGEWIVGPTYAALKKDGAMELRRYGSFSSTGECQG